MLKKLLNISYFHHLHLFIQDQYTIKYTNLKLSSAVFNHESERHQSTQVGERQAYKLRKQLLSSSLDKAVKC